MSETGDLAGMIENRRLQEIHQWFLSRGKTLVCAESCTGGLLSSILTSQPGASQYFAGSVVSYTAAVKENLLNVPRSLIQVVGEVSEPVALSMARGARARLGGDWAVAVTGIAGPGGGTPLKPVGTVCFAVCGPGIENKTTRNFEASGRMEIQRQAALFALDYLWQSLKS